MAEREGFEPSVRCNPYTGLANRTHIIYGGADMSGNADITATKPMRRNKPNTPKSPDCNGSKVAQGRPVDRRLSKFQRAVAAVPRRVAGRLTWHEALIESALEYWTGAKRYGFIAAVKKTLPDAILDGYAMIPDAYRIDPQNCCVVVFEIECSHPIPARKTNAYRFLAWELDEFYWRLILIRVNDRGEQSAYDVQQEHVDELIAGVRRREALAP